MGPDGFGAPKPPPPCGFPLEHPTLKCFLVQGHEGSHWASDGSILYDYNPTLRFTASFPPTGVVRGYWRYGILDAKVED